MVFMLVIMMYPATTNMAVYTTVTAIIIRTEAASEVDLTVYGRLRTVRSPKTTPVTPMWRLGKYSRRWRPKVAVSVKQ